MKRSYYSISGPEFSVKDYLNSEKAFSLQIKYVTIEFGRRAFEFLL